MTIMIEKKRPTAVIDAKVLGSRNVDAAITAAIIKTQASVGRIRFVTLDNAMRFGELVASLRDDTLRLMLTFGGCVNENQTYKYLGHMCARPTACDWARLYAYELLNRGILSTGYEEGRGNDDTVTAERSIRNRVRKKHA